MADKGTLLARDQWSPGARVAMHSSCRVWSPSYLLSHLRYLDDQMRDGILQGGLTSNALSIALFPARSAPSRGRRPRAPLMALPSPILRGRSRPRYTVLRRAADRSGGLPQRRGKKAFWNSYPHALSTFRSHLSSQAVSQRTTS